MSRKPSHRVSKSSPQSRSESPNSLIEPLPSDLEADIARVINENLNDVHNKQWQMLDSSITDSPQAPSRILTLIPNFHGLSPSQPSGPSPLLDSGNEWQNTDISRHISHIPPSPGWFGPIAREQNPRLDGRAPPPFWGPPSPPQGIPYPVPYRLHGPSMPMLAARHIDDEVQRPHQDPSGGHDRRCQAITYVQPGPFQSTFSPVPGNFKEYSILPVPDVGTYHLAPTPEPFMEYAFAFENGLRAHHGPPQFPMLLPQGQQIENNNYHYHHRLPYQPLPPNIVPVMEQQMPEISMQVPQTPPQYVLPLAPHIVVSPPITPTRGPLFPEPHNPGVNYSLQDNAVPTDRAQSIPRSLIRNLSPSRPAKVKRRVQSIANTGNVSLSTRDNQRNRRTSLPITRSPLLEQFRSDRDKNSKAWAIKDILGHIIEFSTDQHGSRFIQSSLEAISEAEKQKIFDEIVPDNTERLIRDVFGNYVIQRFFDLGTDSQIEIFTEVLKQHAIDFSLHIYGCRVVQKAIDCIPEDQQTAIIQRLEEDILTCIQDPNGNHVIQKLVQTVPPHRLTFLQAICDNILALATHSYGCRVLQRCLEHIPARYQQNILNAIHKHTLEFMHDQYGNYVTQFILEHGKDVDRNATLSSILGNLLELSRHKYASNVCEKALIFSDSATRHKLIEEIMTPTPNDGAESHIVGMIQDQYANYVLQRALLVAEGKQRDDLYSRVIPGMETLRNGIMSTYPSKPLLSIERLVRIYFGNPAQLGSEGLVGYDANTNLPNTGTGCPISPY